jgi:hypothetical protein
MRVLDLQGNFQGFVAIVEIAVPPDDCCSFA